MTRTYAIGDLVTVLPTAPTSHLSRAEAQHRQTIPGIVTGTARGPHTQLLTITWPDDRGGRGRYTPDEVTPAPAPTLDDQLAGKWIWYEQALTDTMHARLDRPFATAADLADTIPVPRPRVWVVVELTTDGAHWYPAYHGDGRWVDHPAPGHPLDRLARDEASMAADLAAEREELVRVARARVYARPEDAANGDTPHLTVPHVV